MAQPFVMEPLPQANEFEPLRVWLDRMFLQVQERLNEGDQTNAAYIYSTGNVSQTFTASPAWDEVAAINSAGISEVSVANAAARTITIGQDGAYIVMGAASIQSDKSNTMFTTGISVNGSSPSIAASMLGTGRQAGDQINMRGGAPVNFKKGDVLRLKIQNNDNQAHTVLIRNATLWVAAI